MQGYSGSTTVATFMHDAFGYDFGLIWWCAAILGAYCLVFRGEAARAGLCVGLHGCEGVWASFFLRLVTGLPVVQGCRPFCSST